MNTKSKLNKRLIRLSFTLSILLFVGSGTIVLAEFIETFGHIGTMRVLKGQVRDGADSPVTNAQLKITNLSSDDSYFLNGDDKGVFTKSDLPSGTYSVSVTASGFNVSEYTVRIKPTTEEIIKLYFFGQYFICDN